MERRVERAEALNDAYERLEGHEPDAEILAARFTKEEQKARLEAELSSLKSRMTETAE